MATDVVRVESEGNCAEVVHRASLVLREGGLVAFPTETVYGVGACAADAGAMDRLRQVKQRPADKAFTVHLGTREEAPGFVPELPALAHRFMRKAWPGPITLILPVADPMSAPVMAELNGRAASAMYYENKVGLRCPDHPVAAALLRALDTPVVAASANLAQGAPPCTAQDVRDALGNRIDLIIDAGRTRYARSSTIVRITQRSYELVREGVLDARTVQRLALLRLLFVCTGNTCRSPMAAGIAAKLMAEQLGCTVAALENQGVIVTSAGTGGGLGGASAHALTVMHRRGVDISRHASAVLTADLIRQADHVFTMTASHREACAAMDPSAKDRIVRLLEDEDVRDPIGGTEADYEACAQTVEKGVRARLQEVSL